MCIKTHFRHLLFFTFVFTSSLSAQSFEKEREHLLNLLGGEWVSQGIYAATKLEIPDHLENGPKHISDLATLTDTHEESLYRLLSMLASQGIFREENGKVFAQNETSQLLVKDHPFSLKAITHFYTEILSKSWEGLVDAVKTGQPGFNHVYGQPVFPHFQQNPEQFQLFQQAMMEKAKSVTHSCLENYNFSHFSTVYDIGGGKGHFLRGIIAKNPKVTGVLFDLADAIDEVKNTMPPTINCISGNFFEQVPANGDCYLLKSIIHDWNDGDAKKILTQCAKAMHPQSTLLIVEPILMNQNTQDYAKLMDILMLNVTGGKERSHSDFQRILEESGFQIKQIYPTSTEFYLIEAKLNLNS